MKELRFTQSWLNAESPLTLEFDRSHITTLRFTKPWQNYTSPLTLRFGDYDGTDPEPPRPRQPSIGISLGVNWANAQQHEQHIMLLDKSHKVGNQLTLCNNSLPKIGQQIGFTWRTPAAHGINIELQRHALKLKDNSLSLDWALSGRIHIQCDVIWQTPQLQQVDTALEWKPTPEGVEHQNTVLWREAMQHQIVVVSRFNSFESRAHDYNIAWGPHQPEWICSTRYRPPEKGEVVQLRFNEPFKQSQSPLQLRFKPSPKYCYFDDGGGLIDSNPVLPPIDFKLPIIPQIRRTHIMQPQIICTRVSDDTVIVLKSVTRQISRGQWAASYSVTFSSRIDAERAKGELLKISINGYDFYMLCEQQSKTEAFGRSSYSASGRSRLAELSAPYKKAKNFVNTQARSFLGLMNDIVEYTVWTIASEITDFNVPAYAFSYSDKTPAEALHMIAAAIGAMLDVDDENKVINVIPQWPVTPWALNDTTPDIVLNPSVIIEHSEQTNVVPSANIVAVRGEQVGVYGHIKRAGSNGEDFANDVVDKLITDVQAARMRGTCELANAGNKVQNGIRTKIKADLPPMRPGMLVGVVFGETTYKSICDAVSISAAVSGDAKVTVNQSPTLLRNEA